MEFPVLRAGTVVPAGTVLPAGTVVPASTVSAAETVSPEWSLVIPVKVLARAKSRLTGLAAERRAQLALAMAADTVAAALAVPAVATVIVVTDDEVVGAELGALGAVVVADRSAGGLNPALVLGAAYSDERWPGRGRAAMAGDLPALRPAELAAVLADPALADPALPSPGLSDPALPTPALASPAAGTALTGAAFVPDAAGTGTTLYATAPGVPFRPGFGPGSRDRHLAAGAVELALAGLRGLRQDVDTPADLQRAAALGVGPRTSAVLAQPPGSRSGPNAG
jgi:2-phospho-L-lactate guanylyltransferase